MAGEARPVEGENGGKTVRAHRRHEPRVMRRLSAYLILADQAFPNRINGGRIGQKLKHFLDPRQFSGHCRRRHTQPVLFKRTGRYNPQFNQVLRNDMQIAPLRGQVFDGVPGGSSWGCCGCKVRSRTLVSTSTRDQTRSG